MDVLKKINEMFPKPSFPKSNFINGMVVQLDTGAKRLYWDGRFIDEGGYIPLCYYNNDLRNTDNRFGRENIDKIFTVKDVMYFKNFFDESKLTEIWSRYK